MDSDCIFCKIVTGTAPGEKQLETDDLIVIPDILAQAPVHLVFVSKNHGEEFATVNIAKLDRMLKAVQQMVKDKKLDQSSYRIVMNGAGATLVHNHLHIHLLGQINSDRPV